MQQSDVKRDGACPVCACPDTQPAVGNYVRCRACGLVFLPSGGVGEAACYTREYIEARGHDLVESPIGRAKTVTARRYLGLLGRCVKKGALLDVGCATGIVLREAAREGWEPYGVEINPAAAAIARSLAGSDRIHAGDIDDSVFPDVRFSAITLFDVLEHLGDPRRTLAVLHHRLVPGGALMIVTPDIESMSARMLGRRWPHLFAEHVCLYSPRSVTALLEGAGFRVVRRGWAGKYITLDMLFRHAACHPAGFLSGALRVAARFCAPLAGIVFPFNIGEMYIVARKK